MSQVFFTSDTHYHHKNIIKYSSRPFWNIHHMNNSLVTNWNLVVKPEDTTYFLGDFAFCSKEVAKQIRVRLNGRIVFIRGNHDRSTAALLEQGFDEVHNSLHIELEGKKLFLRHIPIQDLDYGHIGKVYKPEYLQEPTEPYDYWLNGHVHEKWARRKNCINVGVDQWGYQPITLTRALTAVDETVDFFD